MEKKIILSLGAGVQSSTLALMAAHGEITPMPDCAIFADTQGEPAEVYEWLDWLEKQLPFPVHRVTAGNLQDECLTLKTSKDGDGQYVRNVIPAFSLNPDGSKGMLLRKCTADYKIVPIIRKCRELAGYEKGQRIPKKILIEQWLGISLDEIQRMKYSRDHWIENVFPLITAKMTRGHCFEWMADKGYPTPPRSACVFCPYHKNEEWQKLKTTMPDEFQRAVDFEKEWNRVIKLDRRGKQIKGKIFLHRECKPLDEIDFRGAKDFGQLSFLDECDGMCGV